MILIKKPSRRRAKRFCPVGVTARWDHRLQAVQNR